MLFNCGFHGLKGIKNNLKTRNGFLSKTQGFTVIVASHLCGLVNVGNHYAREINIVSINFQNHIINGFLGLFVSSNSTSNRTETTK